MTMTTTKPAQYTIPWSFFDQIKQSLPNYTKLAPHIILKTKDTNYPSTDIQIKLKHHIPFNISFKVKESFDTFEVDDIIYSDAQKSSFWIFVAHRLSQHMTTRIDEYIQLNLESIPTPNNFTLDPVYSYKPQHLLSVGHKMNDIDAEPIVGFYFPKLTEVLNLYPFSNKVTLENLNTYSTTTHPIPTVNSLLHLIIAMNKVITKQIKIDSSGKK